MTTCRSYCILSLLVLCCLPMMVGCPTSFAKPEVDPATATDAVFTLLDKSGDGFLDEEELKSSPALAFEIGEYDANGDKQISKEELLNRFTSLYARNIAYTKADCVVTVDGKPLEGALVKYIPEPYLGEGTTLPASGTTSDIGFAQLSISNDQLPPDLAGRPLLQVGIYKVEITHPTVSLPAKYNTETTLGFELHPERHLGPHGIFDLTSE